ncbi:uncharacterized protein LTR77_009600 [Saxophila tyrrhenica]|uniref:Embryonic stem cell-specific 5-hydroxymethylcytosine-binding protein n=1 Tax=Saxophila tyrrhenica TaxID=1690608 RepID=A0AAV9P275_9PEZI|nr:hypothetical protein LTR77_009600 [Saxophila tyrrhenica]
MCGRYALSLRPSVVRQRLNDQNMPSDTAPSDDDPQIRQSYNFAPGYHGLIYRAATNDRGSDATPLDENNTSASEQDGEPSPKKAKLSHSTTSDTSTTSSRTFDHEPASARETRYQIQSAKWGLIPFWTKRQPDYGTQNGGMWNTMKQRKRCVVVAEGFYEWLKKNGGKEKVPHFVKRKDGGLMCFAGLWDCVRYETDDEQKDGGEGGEDGKGEKLYTYTIITTDSNKQLQFLHDRMPVILEPGSEEMKRWLDPGNAGWNKDLQSMLRPFKGDLECYPVDRAVGKVGNNSPNFIVPIDSKENPNNIANFFGKQKQSPTKPAAKGAPNNKETPNHKDETRPTSIKKEDPESNAPLPIPSSQPCSNEDVPDATLIAAANEGTDRNIKREADELGDEDLLDAEKSPPRHIYQSPSKPKSKPVYSQNGLTDSQGEGLGDEDLLEAEKSPPSHVFSSPSKVKVKMEAEVKDEPVTPSKPRPTRSATSNLPRTPASAKSAGGGEGNKKITAFFGK